MKKTLLLCILDGCGITNETEGNAFKNAQKKNFTYLINNFPHTLLSASGKAVGLPRGQMGNSEVGHLNIGAGQIVYQPEEIINISIENNTLKENYNIAKVISHTKKNKSKLHIMGLISDGGVHSHIDHLLALIDICKEKNIPEIYLHLFTDGRDTDTHSAPGYLKTLENKLNKIQLGKIVTVSGRYYAMDRDNNYDRIKLAYDAICKGKGRKYETVNELFEDQYSKNITDEFILPSVLNEGKISDNDGIIVFNYRPDRLRELFTAITNPTQTPLKAKQFNNLKLVSMFPINNSVLGLHAFQHPKLHNTLGPYLDKQGFTQLRIAETEKYAHVTYFFDGGEELELKHAKRILVPSPKVATYDLKPEMSAEEVTNKLLAELENDYLDVVILNFANGDMVGHTGNYKAAVKAVEFVDKCLGRIYKKISEIDGVMIVTADHGNCEVMFNKDKTPCTTHTSNEVPFIITKKDIELKKRGKISDIAPTILELLKLPIPPEMTADSLIK